MQTIAEIAAAVWRSLQMRLTLTSVVILLVSIWGTAAYVSTELHDDLERLLGEQQLAVASAIATGIDSDMHERVSALEALATTLEPFIQKGPSALQAELVNKPAFQVLFNLGVVAMTADGTVVADNPSPPGRKGLNLMSNPDVQRTLQLGIPTIGSPHMSPVLKASVFSILVPVLDANGKVLGALGGLTNLDQPNFLDIVPSAQYGKTGGFLLVAPEQRLVVTATDKTRIMTALPPPGVHPQMDAMMSKGMGTETWVSPSGVEVLTSGATIPTSGWMVGVSLPTAEAYGPIHRVQQSAAGVALALSGIAALLVWWLLQRQLAPLNEAAMALRLRAGMPSHHFPLQVVRNDEIGDVIEGFNTLLQELHQRERVLLGTTSALEVAAALQESTGAMAQVGGWQVEIATMKLTWTRETFRIAERESTIEPPLEEGINLFAPQARPAISAAVQAAIDLGTPYDLELPIIGERGTHKWVRTQGFAVMEKGETVRLHGTFQDITDRKQNELLKAATLAEKTALLNEVHHRVKNNLQVISSLLRLEAARVGTNGSNTKTVLNDMQARVRSMALLHESLYRTGVFASVDLAAYLRQLAQQSFRAFTFNHAHVRLELDLAVVHLGMDQALPCGLLVNELLSNATKHGFPDGRAGAVRVELLALGGGRCRVCVSDNGVGLPHDFDQRREKSLGLQLVGDLCTQLGGALEVGPGPGSHFSVEFDCEREVEA